MTQAVRDGATRPLYYESRVAQLKLDDGVLKLIDGEYDRLAREEKASELTIERSKREMSQLETLLGHEKTVGVLVGDILAHYKSCRAGLLTGKAMIVAYSRAVAVSIYREILRREPDWTEKVKVVMTESNQDPPDWHALTGDKAYRRELAARFKDDRSELKIAIVVDMWLTGFDVPSLATMYVYKPMVGHNLMQAIARVNRVYGDKEGGLIVDYIGIAGALRESMKRYTRGRGGESRPTGGEIREVAYARFVENLEVCRDLLHGYDYRAALSGDELAQGRSLTGALNWLLAPERADARERFLQHALKMRQAAQLCLSVVGAEERAEATFFEAVRVQVIRVLTGGGRGQVSLRALNSQVEALIRDSVSATGILNVFTDRKEAVSIFSPAFLAELERMKERNLAVEMLKSLLKEQLRKYRVTDLVKSEKFSELMHEALNQYVNGHIDNERVIQELLRIAHEIQNDRAASARMGFTEEEAAFYSALTRPQAVRDFYTNEVLREMTKKLTEQLRRNRTIDWQRQEGARARMRLMVKKLLKDYKYPPDDAPQALYGILRQCELWADNLECDVQRV